MSGILLLGGSAQQVVALEAAKRLGYRTVLCDFLPDNPGRRLADSFHLVSTTDVEGILAVARDERVDGVLAYASDPAALTAARIAEELQLAGNPVSTVETLSNKHLFRRHLQNNGFPCPRFRVLGPGLPATSAAEVLGEVGLPAVVKPTDSSGSKGVSVVRDAAQSEAAVRHARSFSRSGIVIVEEFVERGFPHIIGGDVFAVDGEIRFWGLMDAVRGRLRDGLVPVGEMFPTALSGKRLELLKAEISRLVRSLGISFGELNVEAVIASDGRPYVLELGARAGGNMIPLQLTDVSGIDLVEANVLCAMGRRPASIDFEGAGPAAATYVLHSDRPGVLEGVDYAPSVTGRIYREVSYANPGCEVTAFEHASQALGVIFLGFEDARLMRAAVAGGRAVASVRVSEGRPYA